MLRAGRMWKLRLRRLKRAQEKLPPVKENVPRSVLVIAAMIVARSGIDMDAGRGDVAIAAVDFRTRSTRA